MTDLILDDSYITNKKKVDRSMKIFIREKVSILTSINCFIDNIKVSVRLKETTY